MTQLQSMRELAEKSPDRLAPFQEGEVVEARVISVSKHKVLVDVAGVALGMVPEREFSYDVDDMARGDKVLGYVLLSENKDGYVILSLKRADKERVWTTLNEKQSTGESIKVKVSSANRGGLLVEFGGVEGFIPVSQLSPQHYPKGETATDPHKLITKLRGLIGETLQVKIITIDKAANKLIFSEKSIGDDKTEKMASKVDVGTKLTGTVSGVVDFGLFIKVTIPGEDETIEGLVHISEISWDRVEDLQSLFKPGEEVKVIAISNQNGRLSFSIKRLTPDPWAEAREKLKIGQMVSGEVTRITPFGAFVKLEGNLDGLVHISELGENITDPKEVVELRKKYEFKVLSIEPEARKISLSLKKESKKTDKNDTPSKAQQKKPEEKKEETPVKDKPAPKEPKAKTKTSKTEKKTTK